jgi:hypothetical protein
MSSLFSNGPVSSFRATIQFHLIPQLFLAAVYDAHHSVQLVRNGVSDTKKYPVVAAAALSVVPKHKGWQQLSLHNSEHKPPLELRSHSLDLRVHSGGGYYTTTL